RPDVLVVRVDEQESERSMGCEGYEGRQEVGHEADVPRGEAAQGEAREGTDADPAPGHLVVDAAAGDRCLSGGVAGGIDPGCGRSLHGRLLRHVSPGRGGGDGCRYVAVDSPPPVIPPAAVGAGGDPPVGGTPARWHRPSRSTWTR